jgi:hypothetical protein
VLIFSQVLFYYSSLQAPAKFRPTGVTIIAILNIIEGVTMVVGGILLVVAGTFLSSVPPSAFQNGDFPGSGMYLSEIAPSFLGGGAVAIGGVIIAIGIVSFIVAYGLLKGMG